MDTQSLQDTELRMDDTELSFSTELGVNPSERYRIHRSKVLIPLKNGVIFGEEILFPLLAEDVVARLIVTRSMRYLEVDTQNDFRKVEIAFHFLSCENRPAYTKYGRIDDTSLI